MKPIKKWSKFVAWAIRDIGKELHLVEFEDGSKIEAKNGAL